MARISTYPTDANIADDDIVIGSDGATLQFATKNYSVGSLKTHILGGLMLNVELILSARSDVDQEPAGLDTPLQVTFGPAQNGGTNPVQLDALGNITFNQAGLYLFNGYGNFERQGSSGGTTTTLFRALMNGVQISRTKGIDLSNTGLMVPHELTIPIHASEGDVLTWEIMRDSSGVDGGGLYTHTVLGGWSNVPSADINIWKIGQ